MNSAGYSGCCGAEWAESEKLGCHAGKNQATSLADSINYLCRWSTVLLLRKKQTSPACVGDVCS